jgi:hypothetical protein
MRELAPFYGGYVYLLSNLFLRTVTHSEGTLSRYRTRWFGAVAHMNWSIYFRFCGSPVRDVTRFARDQRVAGPAMMASKGYFF